MATQDGAQGLSVADVLDRAADLIEPEGAWAQGVLSEGGAHCALGAIYAVSPPVPDVVEMFQREVGGPISTFNDRPGRTQAEVVAKLREAAALARKAA